MFVLNLSGIQKNVLLQKKYLINTLKLFKNKGEPFLYNILSRSGAIREGKLAHRYTCNKGVKQETRVLYMIQLKFLNDLKQEII